MIPLQQIMTNEFVNIAAALAFAETQRYRGPDVSKEVRACPES